MKKRRIAFISEHASPLATLGGVDSGGQNVYVAELAKHLAKMGYEIDIYTRKESEAQTETVFWISGIRVIHMQAGPTQAIAKEQLLQYMPQFRDHMIQYIRNKNISYEVIHANFWMSALVACQVKNILGIPFVVTFHALGHVRRVHQNQQDKFPVERTHIEEEIIKHADMVIATCPQEQEDLIQYYHAAPEALTLVPCGFSAKEFYPMDQSLARQILHLDSNEKILLQLGRMVPRKGVDNVIRSLTKISYSDTPVRLLIVGGDSDDADPRTCPEIARLYEIAAQEGVLDKITFAGRKNRYELKYYYAAADIFITTPWYEPFGITPLEAMACGTPVIGSKVGGIKYSIAEGVTGCLVPPNDSQALGSAVSTLLSNPMKLRYMSRNAIQRVNEYFTWEAVANLMEGVYEEVIHHAAKVSLFKERVAV